VFGLSFNRSESRSRKPSNMILMSSVWRADYWPVHHGLASSGIDLDSRTIPLHRIPCPSTRVSVGVECRGKGNKLLTYIAMLKWTLQWLQNIKQSPARLETTRKGFEAAGVRMKDLYLVTGQYDMVAIVEAPTVRRWRKRSWAQHRRGASRPRPAAPSRRMSINKSLLDWPEDRGWRF
jgi:uncharacterized protein with GYD domain